LEPIIFVGLWIWAAVKKYAERANGFKNAFFISLIFSFIIYIPIILGMIFFQEADVDKLTTFFIALFSIMTFLPILPVWFFRLKKSAMKKSEAEKGRAYRIGFWVVLILWLARLCNAVSKMTPP